MWGVGCVEVADLVWLDGEDAGDAAELGGLGGCEADGEAVDGGGVGVEDGGGVRGWREGAEDGVVPVVVGGEEGWLL